MARILLLGAVAAAFFVADMGAAEANTREFQRKQAAERQATIEKFNDGVKKAQEGDGPGGAKMIEEALAEGDAYLDDETKLNGWKNLATIYFNAKDCPNAERAIGEAFARGATEAQLHAARGQCRMNAGDQAGALEAFSAAADAAPDNGGFRLAACVTAFNLKNFAKAETDCARAAALLPDNRQPAHIHALAMENAGKRAEALAAWKAIQAKDPADEEARKGIARTSS